MKFYLAGQTNFGNRGCEALVRSISAALTETFGPSEFLVPSWNVEADGKQWPGVTDQGGRFVQALSVQPEIKWWNRLIKYLPVFKSLWEPKSRMPAFARADMEGCDAVLMIGGDIISLDYGPGSLFMWSSFMDAARRAGYPTMLYAASVGPFRDATFERFMIKHLKRYTRITVRESASLAYLSKLGLHNVTQVADPAFRLAVEPIELGKPFHHPGEGVLGFNLSPLIDASWKVAGNRGSLVTEASEFLRRVLAETGLSIALVPHVDPLDGSSYNSDSLYMRRILDELGGETERLALVRPGLNASQLKYLIGNCRYFIGGRTHATVAGWSRGVPTTSIAYSIKAKGLNQDLFDTLDYVLETPSVSKATLWTHFSRLIEREAEIKQLLAERLPKWQENSLSSARLLAETLRSNPARV